MEKSNYNLLRNIYNTSKVSLVAGLPIAPIASLFSGFAIGGILAEDWLHTDKEIKNRITEVLSSPKLKNAMDYPELYSKFEKYVKDSLQNWIPDRDYPEIGYLRKELLYDQSLGEKEITKYWPEASKKDQETYVALTFDELVLNYELVWNDLLATDWENKYKNLE